MPLVKAQCTNCGAALEVDDSKEASVCPYCNTPYIVEKAINNYNINITNNIHAQTVNVINQKDDFEIVAGKLISYNGISSDIIIPSYVVSIHPDAFSKGLITSVKFAENSKITTLQGFMNQSELKTITIPNSVKTIGSRAFYNCTNLTTVNLPNSIVSIDHEAFSGCSNLSTVIMSKSIISIDSYAFYGCNALTNIDLPENLTNIGFGAFEDCENIKNVIIPDNVTEIDTAAFRGCKNLLYVKLPNKLEKIEDELFSGCKNLADIKIPDTVRIIGTAAFRDCLQLSNIILPNSLTEIDYYVFENCVKLESIIVPSSVVSIGVDVFENCRSLVTVYVSPSLGSNNLRRLEECAESNSRRNCGYYNIKIENIAQKNYSNKKSGCYVATCVYGSYDCPQVWTLRRYRDDALGATWYGRAFIRTYYAISPTLVKWFGKTKLFKKMWQGRLDRMVKKLNEKGVENTPYQDKQW